jgi:putative transposase
VSNAVDYPWSSAADHVKGIDSTGILDMDWWRKEGPKNWDETLNREEQPDSVAELRQCTYAGRPFGTKNFVSEVGEKFGRKWLRGRPKKKEPHSVSSIEAANQFTLF